MSKPSVLISIETSIATEDRAFGSAFMRCLIGEEPQLVPELVSMSERFADPFVGLDDFIDRWWAIPIETHFDGRPTGMRFGGPLWKRKSPLASRGVVDHGSLDIKGRRLPSRLWFESRWSERGRFTDLFEHWVALAKPGIGMLHLFTDVERATWRTEDDSWFETGSFGGSAKPGIPNIGWAMAYGREYASEVDADRISAAGFPVDYVGDVVIVRITKNLSDVVYDFEHFATKRAELKQLFRPDLFWVEDEPLLA